MGKKRGKARQREDIKKRSAAHAKRHIALPQALRPHQHRLEKFPAR